MSDAAARLEACRAIVSDWPAKWQERLRERIAIMAEDSPETELTIVEAAMDDTCEVAVRQGEPLPQF